VRPGSLSSSFGVVFVELISFVLISFCVLFVLERRHGRLVVWQSGVFPILFSVCFQRFDVDIGVIRCSCERVVAV
jgi:hypothetical protein